MFLFFLGLVGGLSYGFVIGCYVGWKQGPDFCRGVVEGFFYPWRCFRK